MKVSEAIEILQAMDQCSELVVYTPCGPDRVMSISASASCENEVVMKTGSGCCEKILECDGISCLLKERGDK